MEVEKYERVEKTITYLIKHYFSLGLDNPQSELSYLQKTKESQLSTYPSSLLRQVKTMTRTEDDSPRPTFFFELTFFLKPASFLE